MIIKKITSIMTAAALICAAACTKSDPYAGQDTVTYSVTFPATKAGTTPTLGQGTAANYVWYALYKTDGTLVTECTSPVAITDKTATCNITMMRDQDYKVVFVAQHYDTAADGQTLTPTYAITATSASIAMPTSLAANSDNADIFYAVDEVTDYDGSKTKTATLTRAVSQVNFSCTDADWTAATTLGMTPTSSSISLKGVAKTFDILNGTTSTGTENSTENSTVDVTYAQSALTGDSNLLGTAYCFSGSNITAELTLYKDVTDAATQETVSTPTRKLTVQNVPVKMNYRTNITGTILTGTLSYTVTVSPSITEATDNTTVTVPDASGSTDNSGN